MEALKVTRKLKEVPVEVEQEDGTVKAWVLKELSGKQRETYLNQVSGRMKYDSEGRPCGIKSFDGMYAGLLALCLVDEVGNLVSAKDLQEFPASTLTALFDQAQELSALNKIGAGQAKNE